MSPMRFAIAAELARDCAAGQANNRLAKALPEREGYKPEEKTPFDFGFRVCAAAYD